MLGAYFQSIDRAVAAKAPHVAAGLRSGADDQELAMLRSKIFGADPIPEDLEAFFRWHNGQVGYESLSPMDNRMLMSIADAVDTWNFLSDPMEDIQQPWEQSWVPILANGAGDHIVYVTSGANKGALLAYWHDAEDRRVAFASLETWARKVLESYAAPAV
jgi:cell wall assembly regulator SMI1